MRAMSNAHRRVLERERARAAQERRDLTARAFELRYVVRYLEQRLSEGRP